MHLYNNSRMDDYNSFVKVNQHWCKYHYLFICNSQWGMMQLGNKFNRAKYLIALLPFADTSSIHTTHCSSAHQLHIIMYKLLKSYICTKENIIANSVQWAEPYSSEEERDWQLSTPNNDGVMSYCTKLKSYINIQSDTLQARSTEIRKGSEGCVHLFVIKNC